MIRSYSTTQPSWQNPEEIKIKPLAIYANSHLIREGETLVRLPKELLCVSAYLGDGAGRYKVSFDGLPVPATFAKANQKVFMLLLRPSTLGPLAALQ